MMQMLARLCCKLGKKIDFEYRTQIEICENRIVTGMKYLKVIIMIKSLQRLGLLYTITFGKVLSTLLPTLDTSKENQMKRWLQWC